MEKGAKTPERLGQCVGKILLSQDRNKGPELSAIILRNILVDGLGRGRGRHSACWELLAVPRDSTGGRGIDIFSGCVSAVVHNGEASFCGHRSSLIDWRARATRGRKRVRMGDDKGTLILVEVSPKRRLSERSAVVVSVFSFDAKVDRLM